MRLVIQSNALARKTVGTEKLLVVAPDYWLPTNFTSYQNPYGSTSAYTWAGIASARQNSIDVFNSAYAKKEGNPSYANNGFPRAAVELTHVHGPGGSANGFENTWRARFQASTMAFPALGSAKRCESVRLYMANTSLWNKAWGWDFFPGVLGVDTTTEGPGVYDVDIRLDFYFYAGGDSVWYGFTPANIAAKNAAAGNPATTVQVFKYNQGWIYWGPEMLSALRDLINAHKTSPITAYMEWSWETLEKFPTCYACDQTNDNADSSIATKLFTSQQPYLMLGVTDL